jgi:UDPglucose--hexose-1-phosphate uridylyltransferase
MPELRQNFFTKEWVVIATERAKHPEQLLSHRERRPQVSFSPNCPFCPGNENQTPPEVLRLPNGDGSWKVRVVPNKFAALAREVPPAPRNSPVPAHDPGFWRARRHCGDARPFAGHALLSDSHAADVLRIYKTRYDELSLDPRIAHITIFKNHCVDAGTSLEHPHSQWIAAPVISYQVRQRFSEALRHHDDFGICMFCQMIDEELALNERIVLVTEHFVGMQPFASPTPFCTHIYPRRRGATWSASAISAGRSWLILGGLCARFWLSCTMDWKIRTSI